MADQSLGNIVQGDPQHYINTVVIPVAVNMLPGIVCRTVAILDGAASQATPALADAAANACAVGVNQAFASVDGADARVKFSGPVTLTTEQWDAVAGTTGGLSVDTTYYLSAASAGHITATVPGSHKVIVGVAISPTTLMVFIVPTAGDA